MPNDLIRRLENIIEADAECVQNHVASANAPARILDMLQQPEVIAANLDFFGPLALRIAQALAADIPQEHRAAVKLICSNDPSAVPSVEIFDSWGSDDIKEAADPLAAIMEFCRRKGWTAANKPMRLIEPPKTPPHADEIPF